MFEYKILRVCKQELTENTQIDLLGSRGNSIGGLALVLASVPLPRLIDLQRTLFKHFKVPFHLQISPVLEPLDGGSRKS